MVKQKQKQKKQQFLYDQNGEQMMKKMKCNIFHIVLWIDLLRNYSPTD